MNTSECPLDASNKDKSPRYAPATAEAALCFQLHDTLRCTYANACAKNAEGFEHQLALIETHIHAYRTLHSQQPKVVESKTPKPPKSAQYFIAAGYRVTSRRHRIISRIDRDDWEQFMRKSGFSHLTRDRQADYYRRVFSGDRQEVSEAILKNIPNSNAGV